MTNEVFILLYLETESGIPISNIPYLCFDEETHKSNVVSARGNSLFDRNHGVSTYNSSKSSPYFDIELGQWSWHTQKDLLHYYYQLDKVQKKAFWRRLEDEDAPHDALSEVLRAFDNINKTLLNRVLALIHLEESDADELDKEVEYYLSSLFDSPQSAPECYKRITVGGKAVVADYLLTRFLNDIEPSHDTKDQSPPKFDSFDPIVAQRIRRIGAGDFSYHQNLEHLHPYEYYEDEWTSEKHLLDDFYYRFNHAPIDAMQRSLAIPWEIDEILPDEVRSQLPQIFIDRITSEIEAIKYKVFDMPPNPKRTSTVGEGSLQDYLGFSGPFSDSEIGN